MNYDKLSIDFKEAIDGASSVVIMQADNPDGDSLASALALESILGDYGKTTYLYCAIDIPQYLKYMPGWDRVTKDFPNQFDIAIVVDTGVWNLFGNFEKLYGRNKILKQKLIVIDEHDVNHTIEANISAHDINAVSSGQIIYELASKAKLPVSKTAAEFIASSILSDTLGMTSSSLRDNSRPFEIMADLVKIGVDVSELQERRLESMKISQEILRYKGELLQRVEFHANGRIATIDIPYEELKAHSQEINPTIFLDEARLVEGVGVTIGFKQYIFNGKLVKVTGRIRCNRNFEIADKIAGLFEDGGGHKYASGFKIEGDNLNYSEIKNKVIKHTEELLNAEII